MGPWQCGTELGYGASRRPRRRASCTLSSVTFSYDQLCSLRETYAVSGYAERCAVLSSRMVVPVEEGALSRRDGTCSGHVPYLPTPVLA
eukprot:3941639-Rhodomonas_salina.2